RLTQYLNAPIGRYWTDLKQVYPVQFGFVEMLGRNANRDVGPRLINQYRLAQPLSPAKTDLQIVQQRQPKSVSIRLKRRLQRSLLASQV
ncbi:MAG: hypothetical protein VB878_12180, partial [Pirellulaceae bacterium]